jgi:hypothetical protein
VPPNPLVKAPDYVRQLREHPNVAVLAPGRRHWALFTELCAKASARGNLVSGADHAALAIEAGCVWITTNRGFARCPVLRWRHPLDQTTRDQTGW